LPYRPAPSPEHFNRTPGPLCQWGYFPLIGEKLLIVSVCRYGVTPSMMIIENTRYVIK
jgi:hypothetical protein